jgi:hypothetical protein
VGAAPLERVTGRSGRLWVHSVPHPTPCSVTGKEEE